MSLIKWLFLTAQPRSDFKRNASARLHGRGVRLYHLSSPPQNWPTVEADAMRPGILRQILPRTLTKSAYFACGATRTLMNSMRHFQHAPAVVLTSSSTIPEKSHDKKLYCCKLRYVQQATCCKSCSHFNSMKYLHLHSKHKFPPSRNDICLWTIIFILQNKVPSLKALRQLHIPAHLKFTYAHVPHAVIISHFSQNKQQ